MNVCNVSLKQIDNGKLSKIAFLKKMNFSSKKNKGMNEGIWLFQLGRIAIISMVISINSTPDSSTTYCSLKFTNH